jgi:hypothetical protein
MLSAHMVRMIEDHAEELTHGLIHDLQSNRRTASYHKLSQEELHHRLYDVYRNLSHWLGHKTDQAIESAYSELGKKRCMEGIPLSEVIYALILTKYHLRDYIRSAGLGDSAVDLHQEQELQLVLGHFFDKAIFYTVRSYEHEAASQLPAGGSTRAR